MSELTVEQIRLLEQNKIIPTNCPKEQIDFFIEVCKRKKLDPFTRQIHLVERKSKDTFGKWVASYTIQAGIDGMRAIAQRNATILSYKRWVEKREDDLYGICEISTSDRGTYKDELPFSEYAQKKSDGTLNSFWAKFPQTMIKKCAEESVLRMMTPEDLSGVYGDDEMSQADIEPKEVKQIEQPKQLAQMVDVVELSKIDYMAQTNHIKTKEEYLLWVANLTPEEDKELYNLKQQIQYRISKLNVEKIIEKINARTNEKTFYTVDQIISEENDIERKQRLIELYNSKLEEKGFEHRYIKTPFEN